MSLLALEGRVVDPEHEVKSLRQRLANAEEESAALREQLSAEQRKNRTLERSVAEIRRQLGPLHNALRGLFGEIELLDIPTESAQPQTAADDRKTKLWQPWIDKFGDNLQGKMLRALLDHGPMTAAQLRVPMQCSQQSIYNAYDRLVKLGLVSSSGGKYHLKEL